MAKYNKLNGLVNSSDFIQKRKEIESLQYKNSEEYSREKEFLSLQKAKDIILYYKTVEGPSLKKFQEMDGSEKISKYESLEKMIQSSGFREKMKTKGFKDSDDSKILQDYKNQKGSTEIKEYYKFKSSKACENYKNTHGSKRLARLNELKELVASQEFKKQKDYLLDKKRFEKTEMYKEAQEYDKLKKNEDIIWYFKIKDSNKFLIYLNTGN